MVGSIDVEQEVAHGLSIDIMTLPSDDLEQS